MNLRELEPGRVHKHTPEKLKSKPPDSNSTPDKSKSSNDYKSIYHRKNRSIICRDCGRNRYSDIYLHLHLSGKL